jgi:anti-sigma B factor antagonist
MEIHERPLGDVTVVDLKGKLLMGESDELLRKKVREMLEGGKSKILLNLAEVSYMDSTGLGGLVSCKISAQNNQGKLKLVNLTARLEDLLSITKLVTVFDCYDNEDEAIKSF